MHAPLLNKAKKTRAGVGFNANAILCQNEHYNFTAISLYHLISIKSLSPTSPPKAKTHSFCARKLPYRHRCIKLELPMRKTVQALHFFPVLSPQENRTLSSALHYAECNRPLQIRLHQTKTRERRYIILFLGLSVIMYCTQCQANLVGIHRVAL